MNLLVTGAGGFVGRSLVHRLREVGACSHLTLLDRHLAGLDTAANETRVEGNLSDPAVRRAALASGPQAIIHLAALPGGAAERDPAGSRRVNIDATLDLLDDASACGKPRIVYASTIAVVGGSDHQTVDDATPLAPRITYGAHKQMIEIAMADLHRRGGVEAVSVRLPGIVARPPGDGQLLSAFMSDIFHALASGQDYVCPTEPAGHVWAMSARTCADNLIHAALADLLPLPASRAVTLPALRFTMLELGHEICAATATDPRRLSFIAEPKYQALSSLPPLFAPAAEHAGFRRDESLRQLVATVLDDIRK